ncbi:MAG: hypothetical protein MJZ67_06625 [Bacteroidales bacterium]|nr:hypothetical protein [Bacteroidales bacterium]
MFKYLYYSLMMILPLHLHHHFSLPAFAITSLVVRSRFAAPSLTLRCSFAHASLPLRSRFAAPSLTLRCSFAHASLLLRSASFR